MDPDRDYVARSISGAGGVMMDSIQLPMVYVADDCPEVREQLRGWLEGLGYPMLCFADGLQLCEAIERRVPSLLFLGVGIPKMGGMEVLRWMKTRRVSSYVVMTSDDDDVKTVVRAVQLGVQDFERKPLTRHRIEAIARTGIESRITLLPPPQQAGLIGGSAAMQRVFEDIRRCARSHVSVLITGESGTGKELIAKAIHQTSKRANRPYVAINCGAIPESLQESELFGHERGAFTGAISTHQGYFEQANTGTIFLDEVAELSASAQQRLLRVLQEHEVQRIGGTRPIELDIRVIAASNRPLHQSAKQGGFRLDLYYRLAVFPIEVPPLRARTDDILPLVAHFARKHGERDEMPVTDAARQVLESHPWPGNVRELENVVQYALVGGTDVLKVDDLPPTLEDESSWGTEETTHVRIRKPASHDIKILERDAITDAIRASGGNVSAAAQLLGMSRATIYRKLARYREEDTRESA